VVAADCEMLLPCVTAVPVPPLAAESEVRLLSYTFTPSATAASVELTMLTPAAPIRAVPLRLTAPVALVVTVELFAAIEPPASDV
jgi:hypothetical protein